MSNSPLVSYTKISPNRNSPRNHKIDTITIHCVVGQVTVERLGEIFAPTKRQASSNYGIGKDGRIGMYVEEKDRSWCSSNRANDHRAITIEVASDTKHPYAVKDKAYNALIDLLVDICKRNGIEKLVWSTNKSDRINHRNGCNMTVHCDYANKSCPGQYLYDRHGAIAEAVNKRLHPETPKVEEPKVEQPKPNINDLAKRAINGEFGNGDARKKALGNLYDEVQARVNEILAPKPEAKPAIPKNGDIIQLKAGCTYWNGKSIPSWVFKKTLYYRGTNKNGVIFSTLKTGAITGVVKPENIIY